MCVFLLFAPIVFNMRIFFILYCVLVELCSFYGHVMLASFLLCTSYTILVIIIIIITVTFNG